MRRIVISSGHGLHIRGARGNPVPPQLDERDQNVRVVDAVFTKLQAMGGGIAVAKFHDNVSTTQNENLNRIVNFHNSAAAHDLDVSVHFNAYDGSAHGTQVEYVTQKALAQTVAKAISALGFTLRADGGANYRNDLAFLNGTNKPAILIETCFCDNTSDSNNYNAKFDAVCTAIAETISDHAVQPGPEPEPEPEPEVATVDIKTTGNVKITVNGQEVTGNGPFPANNHSDITATVFGGDSDPNNSAYPPYDYLDDEELYVALPVNVPDAEVRDRGVQVHNRSNGKSAIGAIRDKGPWMVDDEDYCFGTAEAIAVTCYRNHTPLPRGPNEGVIPSNDAAIDLSPALSRAIGISGKGKVDWNWVEVEIA